MNHVIERPTSLIKPPLPDKPYSNSREQRKSATVSFNRKVRLFEGIEQVAEDAEKEDDLAPLRRLQPKAVTPDQKRWTQIDTTENSSLWITPPDVTTRVGGSCKQKTTPPIPSPRLLSPASPNRLSPTAFTPKETNESHVKPKPKPRARTAYRSSGFILDNDSNQTSPSSHHPLSPVASHRKDQEFTERLSQISPSSYKPPPSPVASHRKDQEFSERLSQISPSSYKPPPTIPHRKSIKETNRRSHQVYYNPPPELHHKEDKELSGGANHTDDKNTKKAKHRSHQVYYNPPAEIHHKEDKELSGGANHADHQNTKKAKHRSHQVYYNPPAELHHNKDKEFSGGTNHTVTSSYQPPLPVPHHKNAKNCNEELNQTSSTHPPSVSYHKKKSDSVIYVNNNLEMAFSRDRVGPKKPRARTQFQNVTYDAFIPGKDLSQRPRASSELANGTAAFNDEDKRMSVLALAQSFGQLKHSNTDVHIKRPKTAGSPVRNGHSSKVAASNPDLLSDDSEEQEVSKPPQRKVQLGQLQRRISKSLSDFDLIEMPEMDPTMYTSGGKVKPSNVPAPARPQTGPLRPASMAPVPTKPLRTYEHDAYVLRKSLKGLPKTSARSGVAQTKSAIPSVSRTVTPLAIHASSNVQKRHVYDDVHVEQHGEEEEEEKFKKREYVTVSPTTLPVTHGAPTWPSKSPYGESPYGRSTVSPDARPASTMSAITKSPKRGKLQRASRIERSQSTEDVMKDEFKISGEYANPEIALMSKNKKEKTRRKPEYSEPYLQRSSSEDSLNRKSHPPVEDSEGYTVPGSHLWTKIPDRKEEERISKVKVALHNQSGEKLIADESQNVTTSTKSQSSVSKKFSRRRRQKTIPRTAPVEEEIQEICPPSPSFLSRRPSKFSLSDVEGISPSNFRQRSRHVHMRQKIQSAFSRQKNSPEDDTLSVTSTDSDGDLHDSVLKKRLTHVRAVKRRTSVYCSLEWYRKTMQYSKLFEYVVVVSLKFNQDTRRHEPYEIKRFPYEISDSQNDKLRAIPLFCFPDAFKWAKVEQYNSESYSFVLTSVDGSRLYGYNRRLLPPGDGPRLPEVYCVMSPIGCAQLYNELLDEIEKRRQVSMQAVEVLLRTARDNPFPRPGERLKIKMPSQPITKPLIIHRPTDSRLEQMNFQCLFDSLDVAHVIQVFASLLLERRVVMCSSKLSKLSSCSQAIAALLYPFAWQHVYVPVLPEKLIDMCCSPTPYIMGMLSLCIPKLDEMPGIDEVIVVDLDSKDFYFLVGDEETILPKKLYVGLQRALSFVEMGSDENINDVGQMEDPDTRNSMISEAFIHFFVETCGHYSNHFSHQFDGTLKFDRDGFLNAVKSRSTRRFLEVFSETQMFSLFIQEKEAESEGICQGLFERRVKLFEREKANNATFSTKMKKIVKDSGLRFALPRTRLKPTK
ncbi:uncharacterized protein [Amphiura filiformis]|uniref:uncharacterized protein isoform X2 n=1 Tax=Amphiura filiformis TaxID=82378 RepID=UPI003B21A1DD